MDNNRKLPFGSSRVLQVNVIAVCWLLLFFFLFGFFVILYTCVLSAGFSSVLFGKFVLELEMAKGDCSIPLRLKKIFSIPRTCKI